MKVLIIGSGGREHAIAWKVAQSPKVDKIYCAPGNAGIAEYAECVAIGAMEFDKLVAFAKEKEIDLTVVGMDDPLVGGVIFSATGSKLSDKADEAWEQMEKAEKTINKICEYLLDLRKMAGRYINSLEKVYALYGQNFQKVYNTVYTMGKVDWNEFTEEEKLATQNSVLLVGLLYKMCKVNLVKKAANEDEMNSVNKIEVESNMQHAQKVMNDIAA